MSLTNKKRRFYTAKTCSKSVAPNEVCATGSFESVNILLRRSLVLVLIFFACLIPVSAKAIGKGEPAPSFTLKDVNGQKVSLEDFKGRVVLLKIGTTWCPTCKELYTEIGKLGDYLKERNVAFIDVFVQDTPAMVEKYLGDTQHPMTFHALLDDGQAYRGYGVYLIPRLLVIDAEQVVRFDNGGSDVSSETIVKLVDALQPKKEVEEAVPAVK